MALIINQARYVNASDVFFGLPAAWNAFVDSATNCSFGNNNRTLVDTDTIKSALDEVDCDDLATDEQITSVLIRLDEIPVGVYVDLEN